MQIFPKTKGFCNKRGLFRKKSLFSIKTAFTFLEKTQIPNIGFYKKTYFFEKIETPVHTHPSIHTKIKHLRYQTRRF